MNGCKYRHDGMCTANTRVNNTPRQQSCPNTDIDCQYTADFERRIEVLVALNEDKDRRIRFAWDDGHIAGREKAPTMQENRELRDEVERLEASGALVLNHKGQIAALTAALESERERANRSESLPKCSDCTGWASITSELSAARKFLEVERDQNEKLIEGIRELEDARALMSSDLAATAKHIDVIRSERDAALTRAEKAEAELFQWQDQFGSHEKNNGEGCFSTLEYARKMYRNELAAARVEAVRDYAKWLDRPEYTDMTTASESAAVYLAHIKKEHGR